MLSNYEIVVVRAVVGGDESGGGVRCGGGVSGETRPCPGGKQGLNKSWVVKC